MLPKKSWHGWKWLCWELLQSMVGRNVSMELELVKFTGLAVRDCTLNLFKCTTLGAQDKANAVPISVAHLLQDDRQLRLCELHKGVDTLDEGRQLILFSEAINN